jgi:hypothetical protein
MQSLFASEEHGGARESSKALPPEIRRLIIDLHADAEWLLALRRPEPASAQESEQDHGFRATTPIAFVWRDWITRKGARPF